MQIVRAGIGILAVALLAVIVWAAASLQDLHGGFLQQLPVLTTLPWGIAALADLYVGFVLIAVLMFLTERSWLVALLWALPMLAVGNVWAALWFVVRLPHLAKQLSKPEWPS